jgi:hypothetical protein
MKAAAVAVLVAVTLTGCVSPSRTDDDYEHKAANTAEAVASSVNTARVGVRAAANGKVFGPYLSRLLAEAEEDADAARQAFDSVQPPSDHADGVHDHLDAILTDALDVLRSLRIAVRRSDFAHLPAIADPLAGIADKLDEFEDHPR